MLPQYPLLTVVMPVFNALPYLDSAIESIVGQTHSLFDFRIYDDCSTDGSYDELLKWQARDSQISVFRGQHRLGPYGSSQAAAELATTEFVARMDADDVSMPQRLEVQLAALQQSPDVALVGSTMAMIDAEGKLIRKPTPSRISGKNPPFGHCTIMYRRKSFELAGGYKQETDYFEDYSLYMRLAKQGRILVAVEPLVKVRFAGQHARLKDDRAIVLRKLDKRYSDDTKGSHGHKHSVNAYYSIAILSILGLERPRMFGEIIRKASFKNPMRVIKVLMLVGLAEISPWAVRSIGNIVLLARERRYAQKAGAEGVLEWSPNH